MADSKKRGGARLGTSEPSNLPKRAPGAPDRVSGVEPKGRGSKDPRVEGSDPPVRAERIQLPRNLSDPLGMDAGASEKARTAPEVRQPELPSIPPIRERRTLPFIRGINSDAPPPPPPVIPEGSTLLHEDHAQTDPAPARTSGLPAAAGPASFPPAVAPPFVPPGSSPPDLLEDGEGPPSRPIALAAQLSEKGPGEAAMLVEEVLTFGTSGLDAVTRTFPGALWFDKHKVRVDPPKAAEVSAAAAALARAGEAAVPHLIHLLGATDREVRLCAALVAREVHAPSVVQPLFRMLVDTDPDNVDMAMCAIQCLDPAWVTPRISQLRASLKNPEASPGQLLMAARTLGALRDDASVASLVERSSDKHSDVAEAVNNALITLTGHDFKKSRSKWRRWWKRAASAPRVSWLLDGLTQPEETLRVRAFRELVLLLREDLGVQQTSTKATSQALQEGYRAIAQRKGLL